jgi:hypothetical protein
MNLAENLADAVEAEGKVLQFTVPSPDAKLNRLADLHRKQAADADREIAETKRQLRKTVKAINDEIKRLKMEIASAEEGAAAKIEAAGLIATACRAFLSAADR